MVPCEQQTETVSVSSENKNGIPAPQGVRLLALLLYFGFAPLAWGPRHQAVSFYWKNHLKQALILWALLGLLTFLVLVSVVVLSVLLVYYRNAVDTQRIEFWILSLTRKALLVWGVFWLYGVWRCLRGSSAPIPIVGMLFRYNALRMTGRVFISLFFVAFLLAVAGTVRAEQLLTQETAAAKTYLLYDDLGFLPRPLFSLAMYRIAQASHRRWGPGSAVLQALKKETLDDAFQNGTFVFVGSHGTAAGLLLDGQYYRPADVLRREGHTPLRYVYLASCDSGAQRAAWESALAPATVKTYDRLTPTLEHLWWLWTEGPAVVRDLSQ
ncbi:MAG: hypothetical protein BWY09_02886 [Candidatus Hydrogenedentes bacterium ADurb.Bin179]|nr:MAG: hypothetical protein BWY09_02886 [Candidatus Hydrogenedentes bacterium ADurb.Bin179]